MGPILRVLVLVVCSAITAPAVGAETTVLERLFPDPGASSDQQKLNEALRAFSAGRYDEAIALCDEVIAADRLPAGGMSQTFVLRAFACGDSGRLEEALANADKATELAPSNARAYRVKAIMLLRADRPGEAVKPARRALKLDPEIPDGEAILGTAYSKSGRIRDALAVLEPAVQNKPSDYRLSILYAHSLALAGDHAASLAEVERIYPSAPAQEYPKLLTLKGHVLMDLDRNEDAVAALEKAVALAPESPQANEVLAIGLYRVKRYEAALQVMDHYLAIAPQPSSRMRYFHGSALSKLGRYSEAIAVLEAYALVRPDDPAAHYKLGFAQAHLGRRTEARQRFERVRQMAPQRCCANWMLGLIGYFEGDYAAAEDAFRKEAAITKSAYNALWLSLIAERRGEDPLAALDRALAEATEEPAIDPIIAVFRGGSAAAAIRSAQAFSAEEEGPRLLCETYVYLAERALIQGEHQQAAEWFAAALDTAATPTEAIFAKWRVAELTASR